MGRKILLEPDETLYYVVDSNFFANKYLSPHEGFNEEDKDRIRISKQWWEILDWQISKKFAIVYINDLCIAETFKIIAKKYYQEKVFGNNRYQTIRKKITKDISVSISKLISKSRYIRYHNLLIDRDIIVGSSRYLEIAHKNNLQSLSVIDLTIISSAKYLIDFFRIKKDQIVILTGDKKIIKCANLSNDSPSVIDSLKNVYTNYFISTK